MDLSHISLRPTEGDQVLAVVNGRYFYLGQLMADIIQRSQDQMTPAEISEDFKTQHSLNISEEQVQGSLEKVISRFGPADEAENERASASRFDYIFLRVKLMGESLLDRLVSPIKEVFRPTIMITLSIISLILTVAYYLVPEAAIIPSMSGTQVAIAYFCLFAVFFLHEVGHATATKYFGVAPHEISFGFYLVFPVFFADVSEIWSLNKKKRIIINLGGVYFQLIINILLIPLAFILPPNKVITTVIHTNIFVMIYSLIPFLRYDGYWIYSDLFEIPNLMRRSIRYPFQVIRDVKNGLPINWALLVYSLTNYIVFTCVFFFVGKFITLSAVIVANQVSMASSPVDALTQQNLSGLFRLFTVAFMGCFLTYRLVRYGARRFINHL